MFEDLTSLWIIGGEAAQCKYDRASAISVAILRRVSHDMVDTLLYDECAQREYHWV